MGKSKQIAEYLGFKGGSQSETLGEMENYFKENALNVRSIVDYLRNVTDLASIQKHVLRVLTPDERRRGLPMPFKPCIERETV